MRDFLQQPVELEWERVIQRKSEWEVDGSWRDVLEVYLVDEESYLPTPPHVSKDEIERIGQLSKYYRQQEEPWTYHFILFGMWRIVCVINTCCRQWRWRCSRCNWSDGWWWWWGMNRTIWMIWNGCYWTVLKTISIYLLLFISNEWRNGERIMNGILNWRFAWLTGWCCRNGWMRWNGWCCRNGWMRWMIRYIFISFLIRYCFEWWLFCCRWTWNG